MVFISIDELLPPAQQYGEHHLSIYGLMVGIKFNVVYLTISHSDFSC